MIYVVRNKVTLDTMVVMNSITSIITWELYINNGYSPCYGKLIE